MPHQPIHSSKGTRRDANPCAPLKYYYLSFKGCFLLCEVLTILHAANLSASHFAANYKIGRSLECSRQSQGRVYPFSNWRKHQPLFRLFSNLRPERPADFRLRGGRGLLVKSQMGIDTVIPNGISSLLMTGLSSHTMQYPCTVAL